MNGHQIEPLLFTRFPQDKVRKGFNPHEDAIRDAADEGYHAGYEDGWEAGIGSMRLIRIVSLTAIIMASAAAGFAAAVVAGLI